jgi:peptidoglycan/xylan/chitin deacetylase (PgdA/CDA1 family)
MKLYKKIYYSTASFLPISLLKEISPVSLLLPYHHLISDEEVAHVRNLYGYKSTTQFEIDLDYLLRYFQALDPLTLIDHYRKGTAIPKNSFLLTFDDGMREVYDLVEPILTRKGVSAVFFLNPAFLDNKELFYRHKLSLSIDKIKKRNPGEPVLKALAKTLHIQSTDVNDIISAIISINYTSRKLADDLGNCMEIDFDEYLRSKKPFLLHEHVKEMIVKGYYFGGHSVDHPNYKYLNEVEQLRQTISSIDYVKSHFDLNYSFFSFPHEDKNLDQHFFDSLLSTNTGIDVLFGTQNQKTELRNPVLHRFNAEDPTIKIEHLIKGMGLLNTTNSLLHNNQVRRN